MADPRQGQNQGGERDKQTSRPETERQTNTEQDQPDRQATQNPRRTGTEQNTSTETGTNTPNEDVETGRSGSRTSEENI